MCAKNIDYDIPDLIFNETELSSNNLIFQINEKLNLSSDITDINTPGNIIFYDEDKLFGELLNKILSIFKLKNIIKTKKPDLEETVLRRESNAEFKSIKNEIKKTWQKVGIIVTLVCDFAQKNNHIYNRIVKGLLIEKKFKDCIDNNSEALFILPFPILINNLEYLLVLDFRFFSTEQLPSSINLNQIKYRARQELLSEIQSKLARHINRQGLLFLD